jgi:predicted membrane protein
MQGIIVSFVGPANFGILYSGIAAAELAMELAGGSIFVATFEGAAGEQNRRLLGIPIAMSAVRCPLFHVTWLIYREIMANVDDSWYFWGEWRLQAHLMSLKSQASMMKIRIR